MNGDEYDGESDYIDEDEPMAVDEFFALPGTHYKKVAFYNELHDISNEKSVEGDDEDDDS